MDWKLFNVIFLGLGKFCVKFFRVKFFYSRFYAAFYSVSNRLDDIKGKG